MNLSHMGYRLSHALLAGQGPVKGEESWKAWKLFIAIDEENKTQPRPVQQT